MQNGDKAVAITDKIKQRLGVKFTNIGNRFRNIPLQKRARIANTKFDIGGVKAHGEINDLAIAD
jgi:hypothetical protein